MRYKMLWTKNESNCELKNNFSLFIWKMRHRYNRLLELNTWVQKKDNVLKNLITSLLKNKRVTTTPKRAKVLKHETEKLFAKLVRTYNRNTEKEVSMREVKRILWIAIYDQELVNSIIEDKFMWYIKDKRNSWFVRNYKVWYRKGDAVEKTMIELV